MISYVYIQSEPEGISPPLYTVGFYRGEEWVSESDWPTAEEAAERVNWLNGGSQEEPEPDLLTCPVGLALSENGCPLVVCEDGSVWTTAGPLSQEWEELLPIPGTERELELAGSELEQFEDPDQVELEAGELEELGELEPGELGDIEGLQARYPGGEI